MSNRESFWPLTAQIAPVLGLALILEARTLSVRFSKPEKRLEKDSRVRSGFAVFGAAILLVLVLTVSLLFSDPEPFFKPFADSSIVRAAVVVILFYATFIVVIVPASLYFSATTRAAVSRFNSRFVWSRARRSLRSTDRFREVLNEQMRQARRDRVEFRLTLLSFVRYRHLGLKSELVFEPTLYCVGHRQQPCETHEEHYSKTLQTMEALALLIAESSDLIETVRAATLRFMVTGTSDFQEARTLSKLEKLRGESFSNASPQKQEHEEILRSAKKLEAQLRRLVTSLHAGQ